MKEQKYSYSQRIGKTTFIVNVKQSESAKKPLNTVTLGTDVFGNLQRMDNALEGLPIKEQACREQLSNLQTQLETAKAEVQKPFPREAELNTKTARLEELNTLLNLDHKEPEIVDAEPDEDQRPPERRRPQLER